MDLAHKMLYIDTPLTMRWWNKLEKERSSDRRSFMSQPTSKELRSLES